MEARTTRQGWSPCKRDPSLRLTGSGQDDSNRKSSRLTAQLDIAALAAGVHVDERERRSLACFARLDCHEVLVILGPHF